MQLRLEGRWLTLTPETDEEKLLLAATFGPFERGVPTGMAESYGSEVEQKEGGIVEVLLSDASWNYDD